MVLSLRAVLFVAYLLLGLTQVQALATRQVWFHESCQNKGVQVDRLWGIIQQMKANARDDAQSTPIGRLYGHIFKEPSNAAFISTTLDAISNDLVATKEQANTLIFCDEDKRWKVATDGETKSRNSKNIRIDRDSNILYKQETLKCSMMVGRARAMGGTYCNDLAIDNRKCSITLCDTGIRTRSLVHGGGLYAYQGRSTDFTTANGAAEPGPAIDNWNLLETVILHEITHSIYNEDAMPLPAWNDLGYGWKSIAELGAPSAKQNADSMAYFGLGSWIQRSADTGPYQVLQSGSIKRG